MSKSSSLFGGASGGALVAAGAALGGLATLAAAHLTRGWCPVTGTQSRCPMTGAAAVLGAPTKKPIVVTVTGAAGQIGYAILFRIAMGRMLGNDQPIELRLLEIPNALPLLQGVQMELFDCASPLLSKVVLTSDNREAFEGCQVALLIGARPRGPNMTRGDLLKANAAIFKAQGRALNDYADRNVKVLVVGNPANTNAKIAMDNAPSLPRTAFTAMTKLDELRAVAQLAAKIGVSPGCIKNVVVWGNHSETQYPDITFASVAKDGAMVPASSLVEEEWARGPFIKAVQGRGAVIIDAMKKSSAASAANAAIEHVRSWILGTPKGVYVSMAVCSNGEYGVPPGLIYSFPVTCRNGEYTIVPGLEPQLTPFALEKMKKSWQQLLDEDKTWKEEEAAAGSSSSGPAASS